MTQLNEKNPCKICNGKQKTRCMICGHQATGKDKKKKKKRKEYTQRERRLDFLGGLYNTMRKYRMGSTGMMAEYQGRSVYIIQYIDDMARVAIENDEEITVERAALREIRKSHIDKDIITFIGDPSREDAPEYVPFRKPKKNDV